MPSPARVGSKEAQTAAHTATAGPPPSAFGPGPPTPHMWPSTFEVPSQCPCLSPNPQPPSRPPPLPPSQPSKNQLSSFAKDMLLNLGRFC